MYELSKSLGNKISKQVEENFEEQVDFLQELVKTKSVNPGSDVKRSAEVELDVARIIRKKLKDLGLYPRYLRARSGRPNIRVVWGPTRARKSLLLVGHMDTAKPREEVVTPFSGLVREGKMYGTGVMDMKASLAVYVYAYKALRDLGIELDGKLRMAFVVDGKSEEASKIGLRYLLNRGLEAKTAILGKPGSDRIGIGHRGGYRFTLTALGEGIETGKRDWETGKRGKNAITEMSKAIDALQDFDLPYKSSRAFPNRSPVFTFPIKNSGGVSMEMVPDQCTAWGDARLMPGNTDKQVKLWMDDKLSEIDGLEYRIEDLLFVPSMEIDKNEKIVQMLSEQAKEEMGSKPKLEGEGSWNDAWMLTERDIPCVAGFGPDGGQDKEGEWVDIESVKKVTAVYARTILDYLGEK